MNKTVEEKVKEGVVNTTTTIKRHIFDLMSAIIIIALVVASLDAFGLREINKNTLGTLTAEWLPFLFASYLLDCNLREKGKFVGKETVNYRKAMMEYSKTASSLTGHQVQELSKYCSIVNERVLMEKQTAILKKEGLTYEQFSEEQTIEGIVIKPLKTMSRLELAKHLIGDEHLWTAYTNSKIKAVIRAKNCKIRGHKVNLLLGSHNVEDETDLGPTELELERKRKTTSLLSYVGSTAAMTVIGINDIFTWGWAGIIIVIFKTAYSFVKSYRSYFGGYNDVVIVLTNHIVRKNDVLKMYLSWYDDTYVKTKENLDGNNIENS